MGFIKRYKYEIGIGLLIVLRGFLNAIVPLMDKTEARYAEIARIMQETNNYITPQIDYGVPFWAKPPLSTWLSALSMEVFGVNEFAVRLPYLLATIFILFVVSKFVESRRACLVCAFVLLTIPEFLLHAGVVSTDTFLALCVAMVFLSFWQTILIEKVNHWHYLFYVFLGFGLLAKGPIVFILTIPPLFIFTLYFKQFKTFFKNTPLFSGLLLMLLIAVPWYYLAEQETKGFLEYFIIGEHFKRFFDSDGWDGDKYGFVKTQPLGIIWVFLFAFAFPWIQVLAVKLWKLRQEILKNKWVSFLLLWLLWAPFFFTFSSSLIHTYILPSIVPIALLISHYWPNYKHKRLALRLSLIFPVLVVIATAIFLLENRVKYYMNTDKYILEHDVLSQYKLYYLNKKSYSSQFYSEGKIENISYENFESINLQQESFAIIIENDDINQDNISQIKKLEVIDSNANSKIFLKK
ncbi:PMT family glycosyltransferase, 4-amino-4-deoxy-L-arabinose transferase [Belliella baltica DSM 15883]|uniref:PMT family glycosyltransferase, 4-amino-4-deoxy-L-arabinose transferase n=1 Tax=Belliella baltica (strain DSM 15883 / CIP 108006 / LMG 21964 / BA134) TaxID=866536 RepID=I3Z8E5_BELBD|nr:glycosyltransferase family 39 protein [Belliella baltica]AFL85513.1 PMT family glycosyltransferase, 4-amino-4-deoxy-L-arabinose transferase [Belliella baltica DSM 15883]